jgi:hypothetical protein
MKLTTLAKRNNPMHSLRIKILLQSASLFLLSVVLLPVQAVATEPADEKTLTTGAAETTASGTGAITWDKTKEVSGEVWEATKEGSAKAWETTREVSSDAWEATKEGSGKAWDKTKEVSGKAWEATKEGSAKAWDKTRELTQPDADTTVETPQPDPQLNQP